MSTSHTQGSDEMTADVFDRQDFIDEGHEVKRSAYLAVMATHGTNITAEAFSDLVVEAFIVNNHVVRAQLLESISQALAADQLDEQSIDNAIDFIAKRLDGAATRLGEMVELVEELKTPGPRH